MTRTSQGKGAAPDLAASIRDLARACALIVSDPEIMGGLPVFRGTRVPVHMITELLAQGSTPGDLPESYPRLTPEMIRLAPIYAAAFPLQDRRRDQSWQGRKPVFQARRRLDTVAVSRDI